ncbi:MAG: LuxR C-terminal-related transcriptional regulator [Cellvibrionaceae bacterium]
MAAESLTIQLNSLPIAVFSNNSEGSLQDFVTEISGSLEQPCDTLTLQDAEDVASRPLLLIDCSCYTPNRIQDWLNSLAKTSIPPVALYNTEASSLHESLLEWPCVRGFFFGDTGTDQIIDGLRLMLEGDFWVPRRLLHAYLERNRRAPTHNIKAPELLTKREREILGLLENGATNAAMAKAMSVSEHTIKTHLYNIYKKIDVANRIEAINWSRQNLSAQS